jgi:hypothetical protein
VIQAFLDHLEGAAERPNLDQLTDEERREAEALMASLEAARGIDPSASRPSIERLLAGTPFEQILHAHDRASAGALDIETVRDVLAAVDGRARVEIDHANQHAVYSFLDLRARFVMVDADGTEPFVTDAARSTVDAIFHTDPDTTRVGIVAAGSQNLITQMLAAHDLGRTITTPNGSPHIQWEPPLPLSLAVRRMLEQCAPEWDRFDFDPASGEAVDIASVATELARRLIAQEAARRYQGEKARAYKSLLQQADLLAELTASVLLEPPGSVDLDAEVTRIVQAAA